MGTLSPREALGNKTIADKLQKLFQTQKLPVDMESGYGMETLSVFSLDEEGKPKEKHPFANWASASDEERKSQMQQLLEAAETGNLMAFQIGSEQPLNIRIQEDRVSVSRNTGRKPPEKPGIFKRLFHSMNSSWFQSDFDQYEASRRRYDLAQKKIDYYKKSDVYSIHQDQLHKAQKQRTESGMGQDRFLAEQNKVQKKLEETYGDLSKAGLQNLITIDGKTLSLCVRNQVEKDRQRVGNTDRLGKADISKIQEQAGKQAAEYITAALLTGKHVELHSPQNQKAEVPLILKAEDLGLSKAPNVQEMGRERCEKLALNENIDDGQRFHRMNETRLLVEKKRFLDKIGRYSAFRDPIRGQFVNRWLQDHADVMDPTKEGSGLNKLPNEAHGMSVSRGCIGTHAIGMLMAEGKKLEDILNPDMLVEEKAEAGGRFLDTLMQKNPQTGKYSGDSAKLAEYNVKARQALMNYVDQALKGMDFTQEAQLYSDKFRLVTVAMESLFDLDQESAHLKQPIQDYLKKQYPGKEKQVDNALSYAACGFGNSVRQLAQCQRDMVNCALGNTDEGSTCANSLFGYHLGQKLTWMMKNKPEIAPTQLMPSMDNMDLLSAVCSANMGVSPTLKNAVHMNKGMELAQFGRKAIFGDLKEQLVFSKSEDGVTVMDIKSEREAHLKREAQLKQEAEKNVQQPAPQVNAPVPKVPGK